MVIVAEISSLSPPLDFQKKKKKKAGGSGGKEGLGRVKEGCYGPLTQSADCDFLTRGWGRRLGGGGQSV